ncbi:putative zinc-binding metallopeptidase [Rhizobiaceae bacterium BDR2-2]|uniref:Zinc-binding metallopeptidase n=1 Tax=Ectorhizobium quercum TaxID=2965071 RepID=A0AAE3N051_9HYPH|nr:putative zinc-binding metallopeptidase [Ectorhizobium quercum]MCX8996392.1 putative zinc-binding metallopeptidase [Ectorhizobium quercum]MCX8998569.1 putative zinc-binding metallopeptidase [Ectorhizobium quercum]
MRLFACDACGHTIHFDNRSCVNCGHNLGFVPERLAMHALEQGDDGALRPVNEPQAAPLLMCANAAADICNWTVPVGGTDGFCLACRHNRLVPNTDTPQGLDRWRRIGQAQRHLFYSILKLNLPHPTRMEDPQGGLVFDLLEDQIDDNGNTVAAMTLHDEGRIAIRAAEADDAVRVAAKENMDEPYRTMLGHFRHEVGHFIWNKLVRDVGRLEECRAVFGDERQDYAAALQYHYENGPPLGWQQTYISSYATTHPWEDFAECFAHYLHIADTLETAHAFGIAIDPRGHEEMAVEVAFDPYRATSAAQLVAAWVPLSVAINSIQRSLGEGDIYPFVLTPAVTAKLEYIHQLVQGQANAATLPVQAA